MKNVDQIKTGAVLPIALPLFSSAYFCRLQFVNGIFEGIKIGNCILIKNSCVLTRR